MQIKLYAFTLNTPPLSYSLSVRLSLTDLSLSFFSLLYLFFSLFVPSYLPWNFLNKFDSLLILTHANIIIKDV